MSKLEKALNEFSDYLVYVDESGDHGLESFGREFPVFVLSFCIFHREDYFDSIVPRLQKLKFKHFGRDTVVFHEREIRRKSGEFAFLNDPKRCSVFFQDLNGWVESSRVTIIGVVIRKPELVAELQMPPNPYHLAMQYGLERVDRFMKKNGQRGRSAYVVFEARGKNEDDELRAEFTRVCEGENYAKELFDFRIEVVDKRINSCGLQLADLTARPIGMHVIKPNQLNRAYSIIEPKLDRAPDGRLKGCGLKCYPEKQEAPAFAEAACRPTTPVPPLS